jgi:ABC-type transporter Mla maintaining outer membrane lipid asymmetry ATPase subunit MlaF
VSVLAPDAAPAPVPVLEAIGLGKACGDRAVLADFDFAMERGEFVVLHGANGAGKSLLLRLWLGLERPDAGSARLLGGELALGSRQQRRALLARTGVVFEQDALFEDRSVGDNVALALAAAPQRSTAASRRAVHESLLLVGLKHVDHLRPRALPAGTRRRVALARAIVHRPELLLVDEPAAGLDPIAGAAIHELIAQLRTRLDLSVLIATRHPAPASTHATRTLRL